MNLLKTAPRPSTRLNKGNVLLANAQVVNTRPLKARFDAFVEIHRRYIEAHHKVEEAQELEHAERQRLALIDGAQNREIAALSAALLLDGEPRRNPFARFSEVSAGEITGLPLAGKVSAVHRLISTLRRSMGLADFTLEIADKAEQGALKLEQALPGWELRRTYLASMRQQRNSLGTQWDTAYGALRYLTKSIVEERQLYVALFPRHKRHGKKGTAEDQSSLPAADEKAAAEITPPVAANSVSNATPADSTALLQRPPAIPQAA